MIGYVTIGTNDLARAARFYDAIAKELGTKRMMETERFIAWGAAGGGAGLGLARPFDGNAASVGNGVMVALAAKDKAQVDRIHKLALSLGGKDEGAPGRALRRILRRVFSRSGRQQAQRLRDGLKRSPVGEKSLQHPRSAPRVGRAAMQFYTVSNAACSSAR